MLKTLDRASMPEGEKDLIKKYVRVLQGANISAGRVAKYIATLKVARMHLKCNFADAGRAEIEDILSNSSY